MPRTSALLVSLFLTGVLALRALPVPTAKEAADDWTVALNDRPGVPMGGRMIETVFRK